MTTKDYKPINEKCKGKHKDQQLGCPHCEKEDPKVESEELPKSIQVEFFSETDLEVESETPKSIQEADEISESKTSSESLSSIDPLKHWRQFGAVFILSVILSITSIEMYFGFKTGSLLMLLFGFHGACKILVFPQRKKKLHGYTYDDLSNIVYVIFLVNFSFYVSLESIQRLYNEISLSSISPEISNSDAIAMFTIVIIDFFFNVGVYICYNYQNFKKRILIGLLKDTLGALPVIASNIAIYKGQIYYLDPGFSLVLVVWILIFSVPKAWKSLNILLEKEVKKD